MLDGPYADTKEQLGGYLPDRRARSRCGAVLGGALPERAHGTIEVRPIWPMSASQPDAGAQRARPPRRSRARSYGKLVAFLAARTRDVAAAEDALADAFAAALADWPASGVPHSPEAWLLTVARRKMIDAARRRRTGEDARARPAAARRGAGGDAASERRFPMSASR